MIRSSSQNPFFNPTDHVRKTESLTPLVLARSQGAAHPDQLASTLFTKKPHIVRALFDRQNYKDELNKFKRERPEKHYQRLLNELRVQNPDPQAIKRHFKKLSSCGPRSTPSYAAPIPPSEQGRLAMVKDCEVLRESIDKALVYFSPASATTDFLTHLKVQLGNQVVRIDEVLAREEQLYAAYARMASDLKREHGQAAMMS
jgi:hypothetical protein